MKERYVFELTNRLTFFFAMSELFWKKNSKWKNENMLLLVTCLNVKNIGIPASFRMNRSWIHFSNFEFICITKCNWLCWNDRKLVQFSEMFVYFMLILSLFSVVFLNFSSHEIHELFIYFFRHQNKFPSHERYDSGERRAFCLVNENDL